jgi:diguanylate cyclase (GGDEF)-like protein
MKKDLWISMNTSALRDKENNIIGGVGIVADITQRMNIQQTIQHQANFDALTDIPNRMSLIRDINKEIIRFKRHQQIFGIIFLDLDHFKNINDSLGHDVGDKLLIETAQRLKKAIRGEDTVARIGGDEFVVLLPDLTEEENIAATNAEYVAQKIHETLRNPFNIEGYNLNISSSIGITLISDNNETSDDLLKHADIAMYQSKKEGRNTSRFYREKMDIWVKRRLEIENELRNAINNDELSLHYQPIIEFSTSCVVGAEALLRWKSPKLGEVFPDEFIPIAEESGLIISIGEWVLQTAVKQFVTWQKQFPSITTLNKIAVNVSVNQFNSYSFLKLVRNTIERYDINPKFLELELTESIIAKDVNLVRHKMQELRDIGVKLSIDDFGTGYSSLSYLKKLPFTTLKIDKSFTQDIMQDTDDKELISTIITIAENFNLEVVIEGVETLDQYLFVKEKKATFMQGYYCSKPMEEKSFELMLQESKGICSITALQG